MVEHPSATASRTAAALVSAAALILILPASSSGQTPIRQLVVFGTSLSDPGNAFALVGGTNTPPDYAVDPLLVPDRPYARGGHHFTDGATWAEYLARVLRLPANANPAFGSANPQAMNFAVGAARARDLGLSADLSVQVDLFLQRVGGVAPPDALYAIEMGTNDVRDAIAAVAAGGNGVPIIEAALGSIAARITTLYQAGARNFLVWNVPDPALTPAVRAVATFNPAIVPVATQATLSFNAGLEATLSGLSAALPGADIRILDAFALLQSVVAAPTAAGFTNVTDACIQLSAPFVCKHPRAYLFWDGVHPSTATHALVAVEAIRVLGP